MLIDALKKVFTKARIRQNDDGTVTVKYTRPTRLETRIVSENQIPVLREIMVNAGVEDGK